MERWKFDVRILGNREDDNAKINNGCRKRWVDEKEDNMEGKEVIRTMCEKKKDR